MPWRVVDLLRQMTVRYRIFAFWAPLKFLQAESSMQSAVQTLYSVSPSTVSLLRVKSYHII